MATCPTPWRVRCHPNADAWNTDRPFALDLMRAFASSGINRHRLVLFAAGHHRRRGGHCGWSLFLDWLNLQGIFVSPIDAVARYYSGVGGIAEFLTAA